MGKKRDEMQVTADAAQTQRRRNADLTQTQTGDRNNATRHKRSRGLKALTGGRVKVSVLKRVYGT
jgi:hypothetical protein